MSGLEGRVALITGAARGQGRAHAVRLAQDGADIIALDICADIDTIDYPNASAADLQETVRLVEALDRRIIASETDVRDASAVRQAVDAGVAELGRLDIVLGNAGVIRLTDNGPDPSATWADIIATNLTGVWNAAMASVEHIRAGGRGGAMVLTGSTAALRPTVSLNAGALAYTAAKFGIVGLARQLAVTLAPDSIRVNTIHPTGVRSGMTMNESMGKLMAEAAAQGNNAISAMQNALPIDILEPEDISEAVAFLVSDKARWITGVSLPVDAGFSLL
jgi:SDR family mycofactocin-dependent oxidoreductase